MSTGLHWEWRAFGGVSSLFARNYYDLHPCFRQQEIEDRYLYIPGLKVNIKIREGRKATDEGGLKFKRLEKKDGDVEKWKEDKNELFDFPLSRAAWKTLSEELSKAHIGLSKYPQPSPNRDRALDILTKAGCEIVTVKKVREARLRHAENGMVKVEWACISDPQSCVSIGLETWTDSKSSAAFTDKMAIKDINLTIEELGLKGEPLSIMNYMNAIEIWAKKMKI